VRDVPVRFCEYNESRSRPNIVVDGSPNEGTVLTLTHWPGFVQPPGLEADLSAQMAFQFVRGNQPPPADIVTNNHFDQDGLVSMFAFVAPAQALRHEPLLTDLAAAGDFGTYRFREAARASMALWTYANPERSPIAAQLTGSYPEQCAVLYEAMLPRLVDLVTKPERYADLWADEDAELTATERALASGAISIDEHPAVDLAVVRIASDEPEHTGHRFAADQQHGAHPMAINNATSCFRVLRIHGQRYEYTDRYETWVQYRSRRPLPRVDLRPLADQLTSAETGAGTWTASAPSTLEPQLTSPDRSTLDSKTVVDLLTHHLASAPPAWDPYSPRA
jgi:hypothetical protein